MSTISAGSKTVSLGFPLAFWTNVGAAASHHDALDGSAALRAVFAYPVSDAELVMGGPGLTVGAYIVTHAGSLFP